jgi:hypothetical protein
MLTFGRLLAMILFLSSKIGGCMCLVSCYRHRSGGTDCLIISRPDVVLPTDAYLHMFDSESNPSGDLGRSDSDAELVEVFEAVVIGRMSASEWVSAPCIGCIRRLIGLFDLAALRGCHNLRLCLVF